MDLNSKINISFFVKGETIPTDHNYALFSALSKLLPDIHEDSDVGIDRINGNLLDDRRTQITSKSRLFLRLPFSKVPAYCNSFSGKEINIKGEKLVIGSVDKYKPIQHESILYSRIVVYSHIMDLQKFIEMTQKEAFENNLVKCEFAIKTPDGENPFNKKRSIIEEGGVVPRTFEMKGEKIKGYGIVVRNLSPEESLFLQENGLGGKRHFGCGLFIPYKHKRHEKTDNTAALVVV